VESSQIGNLEVRELAPSPSTSGWLTSRRFALLLGALVLASFPAVIFGTRTFIVRDYGLFSYPVAFFQRESFWRGELPLWNPYNHCGLPFLAQWNTLALYPPALLYLLTPLTWGLSFFCLAHLFWGGLGMYQLARHWTGNSLGAALAGIAFSFNGLMLNFLMWPSHVATFSWLPWVLWLGYEGLRQGGRKWIWATAAATMQMLAGGPETILFTWLILLVLAIRESIGGVPNRWMLSIRLAGMGVLVTLISAAQLLPFLELLSHSQRESSYGSAEWAMPISGWLNFLVPLFRTVPSPQGIYFQAGQYWTSSYYAGVGTILLGISAVAKSKDPRTRWLATIAILGLVLALGNAGLIYKWLRAVVPVLGFVRYPIKFVIPVLGLLPILAAFGWQAWANQSEDTDRHRTTRLVMFAALALFVLSGIALALDWPSQVTLRNGIARLLCLATLLILARLYVVAKPQKRGIVGGLLLLLFWADLFTHMPTQNPTVDPSVYAPGLARDNARRDSEPRLGESRSMAAPQAQDALKYRALSKLEDNYLLNRLGSLGDCNLLEHTPIVYGFFSLVPGEASDASSVAYVQTNHDFSGPKDFMGVSVESLPNDPFEWKPRPTAMPLITIGQQPLFADDRSTFAVFYQTNFDFRRQVFLPLDARGLVTATQQVTARILENTFTANRIGLKTYASGPSMVVISQSWYPAWKAYVDGMPVRIWRANYAFDAVEVPAGQHRLELKYQDRALFLGALLSAMGLLVLGLLATRTFVRVAPRT
jgi:hypothetical protein